MRALGPLQSPHLLLLRPGRRRRPRLPGTRSPTCRARRELWPWRAPSPGARELGRRALLVPVPLSPGLQ
eukprot:15620487-Heterocapsa_arctica.AAC.1